MFIDKQQFSFFLFVHKNIHRRQPANVCGVHTNTIQRKTCNRWRQLFHNAILILNRHNQQSTKKKKRDEPYVPYYANSVNYDPLNKWQWISCFFFFFSYCIHSVWQQFSHIRDHWNIRLICIFFFFYTQNNQHSFCN